LAEWQSPHVDRPIILKMVSFVEVIFIVCGVIEYFCRVVGYLLLAIKSAYEPIIFKSVPF
jgi:hypothetical protein